MDPGSALRSRPVGPPGFDPLDYNKTGVELEARADPDFPVTVLRLPAVHGPGDYAHRLYPYVKRMLDGRPATLLDRDYAGWRWTRGYVENVAHAVVLAVTDAGASGRVYNVAEPAAYTEAEWIARIAGAFGWHGRIVAVEPGALPEPMRAEIDTAQAYVVDSSSIRTELGYLEVVGEHEALGRTIEWERTHPPAHIDVGAFDYDAEDDVLARLGP